MDKVKKCKCCLEDDGLLNLWDEYKSYGESIIYGVMIKECFSIPLRKPAKTQQEYICESCITRLTDAVNFKKEILSSNTFLEALNIGSHVKQETESDIEIKTEYLDIECLLDDDCVDIGDAIFSDDDEKVETIPRQQPTKKRLSYMQIDVENCVREIRENGATINDAAAMYDVPEHVVSSALSKQLNAEKGVKKFSRILSDFVPDEFAISPKNPNRRQPAKRILPEPIEIYGDEQIFLNYINEYSNATPFKGFNGRAYECYFCSQEYEDPIELKMHTRNEHRTCKLRALEVFTVGAKIDVTDLTCLLCHKDLNLITDYSEHLKKEHNKEFNDDAVNYLIPIKFNGDELKCVVCSENFLYFKLLYEHMKKHIRNFECELCGCGFITRRTLRAHIRRHDNGEYKCSYCPKVFYTQSRVTNHEKQVHLKIKRNKCVYCDEKFVDLMQKKKHESVVHGAKKLTFNCQACERQFQTRKSLSNHIKDYHLMIRNHKCELCAQRFPNPLALKEHMVKHTRTRDFICKVCKKGFSRKTTLVAHMRIHLNDRRYKCDICGCGFVQKCSLKNHMASKHPNSEV